MMVLPTLSWREKWLVGTALGLGLLFALWQFGFVAMTSAREQAQSHYETASREHQIVTEGIASLRQQGRIGDTINKTAQSDATNHAPLDRAAIMALVRQYEVPVSQVQPDGDTRFNVWLSGVDTKVLYDWLSALHNRHGDHIINAHINKTQEHKVDAYFVFTLGAK